jgi:glycerol uptake operon antiterminator
MLGGVTSYAPPAASEFVARLAGAPCCAAIVEGGRLEAALASRAPAIFLLRGNGLEISDLVRRVHDTGKLLAVHLDLVDGLKADHWGVSWLARSGVDAVITSHGQLMPVIRNEGAIAIHRLLLSRREHLDTAVVALRRSRPDIVEILPGVILPAIVGLLPAMDVPMLAGGFIRTPLDARLVLAAGAIGVTTSSEGLWDLRP